MLPLLYIMGKKPNLNAYILLLLLYISPHGGCDLRLVVKSQRYSTKCYYIHLYNILKIIHDVILYIIV